MEQINTNYYGSNRSEMLEFIPKSSLKILEIGCGEGSFSAQLKSENNETWGIEPNKKSWEIASQKLYKVVNKTLENATEEIPDNYFDFPNNYVEFQVLILLQKILWFIIKK